MVRYLVAFAFLCFATAAIAQTPDTVFIEKLAWDEVRDAIAAGKTTIIVPTGGTEQNGPHMALGKHNVRVAANADHIARRLGNTLVAPVVAYTPEGGIDPPTGHVRVPGTVSIPDPVFRQVLEYIARSLEQHGFRDILFIGDSGPNQAGQIAVAAMLNAEWSGASTRVHADPRDTSQMMAVDPTMVRNGKLQAGDGKNGIQGDPRRSTAEIGRVLNERNVTRTIGLIRQSIAAR